MGYPLENDAALVQRAGDGILGRIGNTSLVPLRRIVPGNGAAFAGTSTGANVVAALRLARRLGAGATVVTIMCDTGMKYLKSYGARLKR